MRGRSGQRWLLYAVGSLGLLWLAWFLYVAMWVPRDLRRAAESMGLRLQVGAARSLHPRELSLRDAELEVPSLSAVIAAEHVLVEPIWRSLLSSGPMRAEARASGLELRRRGGSLEQLEARWREAPSSPRSGSDSLIEIRGAAARWQAATRSATLALLGHLTLSYHELSPPRPARWVFGDAVVDISDVVLTDTSRQTTLVAGGPPGERLGMHGILRIESATLDAERGLDAAGSVYVRGEDASVGLDLAGAPESVRWMLADLEGRPFVLEAALRACTSGLELDGVRFESGLTQAQGTLRATAEGWSGVVQVRRGSLSLGLSVTPRGIETQLSPPPFWLDEGRARAHDICVSGAS